ncbi:hypothetical protein EDC94DRAFT_585681 [Helicostylum pulchrum]|nr:hypothetical protein EDC94DRAFT_585681 [Helicostylum pulchrum]
MTSPEYDRNIYGVTPPREPDEETLHPIKRTPPTTTNHPTLDPESLNNAITLLKARLQYAQLKIKTGLSTEQLQRLEPAFLSSPRQPRIPLPHEYPPPEPAHFSSAHSRKLKRLLLSAMSPQKKKKKKQQQQQDEEEEDAARTILMLAKPPSALTPPPSSESNRSCIGLRSPDINQARFQLPPPPVRKKKKRTMSLYDVVAKIPNYEEKARRIGKSLPKRLGRMQVTPPPAVVCHQNQITGSPHHYYQYNRPLPHSYYDHSVPEDDPFYSRPIVPVSSSRYNPPPSPPLYTHKSQ